MKTSVGMILIAQVKLAETHDVAIREKALASYTSTIASFGTYDMSFFIPWQVMIFVIVVVMTLTFVLGCVYGRLTSRTTTATTSAAPKPEDRT
eukprot:5130849-Heterocapsa_arctica.AAC.1